jgi:hypothetical protein
MKWVGEAPKRLIDDGSVWVLVAGPVIWAAHFLLVYWIAAVYCAKAAAEDAPLDGPRLWIVLATIVALGLIGLVALHARRRYNGVFVINEEMTEDSLEERLRFLGHVALILCGLSVIAVLFSMAPALVLRTC